MNDQQYSASTGVINANTIISTAVAEEGYTMEV